MAFNYTFEQFEIFLIFYRIPANDGNVTLATAHYDAADIPVHATTPALTVLTRRRGWYPQQDATDEVLGANGRAN